MCADISSSIMQGQIIVADKRVRSSCVDAILIFQQRPPRCVLNENFILNFQPLWSDPSLLGPSLGRRLGNHPHVAKSILSSPRLPSSTMTPSCRRATACRAAPPGPLPQTSKISRHHEITRRYLGDIMPFAFTTLCHGTLPSWKYGFTS